MIRPNDFGPIYAETDMARFPVEPLNTLSNLIFLFVILWTIRRTHLSYRAYPLLVLGLPILVVGFIGGTIFHATRSHSIWLILDFVPIIILAYMGAVYFWHLVLQNRLLAILLTLVIVVLPRLLFLYSQLPRGVSIGIGYASLAAMILVPAFVVSRRQAWADVWLLIGSMASFIAALIFRTFDRQIGDWMPVGSHFLWHIFGGISVFLLFEFIARRYERTSVCGST